MYGTPGETGAVCSAGSLVDQALNRSGITEEGYADGIELIPVTEAIKAQLTVLRERAWDQHDKPSQLASGKASVRYRSVTENYSIPKSVCDDAFDIFIGIP